MNILQAMNDPKLFGLVFKRTRLDGDTWSAWRAFLAALFALPLESGALNLYRKHTGRTDLSSIPYREAFAICGRRAGKSLLAAFVAVFLACFRDYADVLAPGETGIVMLIASDRRQARVLLNYVNGFFDSIAMLAGMVRARRKDGVELTNGLTVEIVTSDFRAVRGYTIIGCICDELAFWPVGDSANPDSEILDAVRPGMASVPTALLLGISSPYARRGALWGAYREHFGKVAASVLVWQAASMAMNPTLSPAVIEQAYRTDPASASAEYGAEFRSDVEDFISLEVVESRVIVGRFELPPIAGVTYTAFVDPSGGQSDSMTLGISHVEGERGVLDVLREREAPFSPDVVTAEFSELLKQYRVSQVTGDRYAGEWPREAFQKRGISYRTSGRNRSEIYLEFLPALMSAQVELLDSPRLKAQLVGLERHTARAGKDTVDHAPGGHDDVANSAAGALCLALQELRVGLFGVLRYFSDAQAMKDLSEIESQSNPPLSVRVAGIMRRNAETTAAAQTTCPQCGAAGAMIQRIAGGSLRCGACAKQWGATNPATVAVRGPGGVATLVQR